MVVDIFWGTIFIVIFYFVFKFIWNNVTTVSFNGLEGFFSSWWNQVVWAFVITCVIIVVIAVVLNWIINAFDMDILKYLVVGFICYLFSGNSSDESTQSSKSSSTDQTLQVRRPYRSNDVNKSTAPFFVKKIFMDNYNRNVRELRRAENFNLRMTNYVNSADKNSIVDGINNEIRAGDALTLPENFLTRNSRSDSTDAIQFANVSISHSDAHSSIEILLTFRFDSDTAVNHFEKLLVKIAFPAAIESVAPGNSKEIKRALSLINDKGEFLLPPYDYANKRDFNGEYEAEGVHYLLSRTAGFLSMNLSYHG